MKVVLFCGGMGLRLREYSEYTPKPLVLIGDRPIVWHLMKYYAHFGHKDFILCLGWQGNMIKEYFLRYDECLSNDFVMTGGGADVELLSRDINEWKISFVDTGVHSGIGERLRRVKPLLEGEEVFLANYADGLTDLHLPKLIEFREARQAVAAFVAVRPNSGFHVVRADEQGVVESIQPARSSDFWVNGGFFVMHQRIFDYLHEGEELVPDAFNRLVAQRQLACLRYEGYWSCMDTYKERQLLEDMHAHGQRPWQVWNGENCAARVERSERPAT